jgi:FKBP-type peptidyl-prolyl cis-trans isomerase FkpA
MYRLLLLVLSVTLLSSCLKKSDGCSYDIGNPKAPDAEITALRTYLNTNSITATEHSSGLFYQIITPGTGASVANLCNTVSVNYVGKLTNGTQFDPTNGSPYSTAAFGLSQLIKAWQIGIPLIKAGGKIKLYVPPSLGYGSQAQGSIPANSVLVFDIDLLGVG